MRIQSAAVAGASANAGLEDDNSTVAAIIPKPDNGTGAEIARTDAQVIAEIREVIIIDITPVVYSML